MTRSELFTRVRDLLDEQSTAVLSDERLRRIVQRTTRDFTRRTQCLTGVVPYPSAPGVSSYPLPQCAVGVAVINSFPAGRTITVHSPLVANPYSYTWPSAGLTTDERSRAAYLLWADYTAVQRTHGMAVGLNGPNIFWISPRPWFTSFTCDATTEVSLGSNRLPVGAVSGIIYEGTMYQLKRRPKRLWAQSDPTWADSSRHGDPVWWDTDGNLITVHPAPTSTGTMHFIAAFEHPLYEGGGLTDAAWDDVALLIPDKHKDTIAYGCASEASIVLRDRDGTAALYQVFKAEYEAGVGRAISEATVGERMSTLVEGCSWQLFDFQSPEV